MRRRALLLTSLAAPALAQPVLQNESLASGWRLQLLARWGDAVLPGAPPWNPAAPDAEAAGQQFGWDARLLAVIAQPPATDRLPRAVAAVAHPGVDAALAFADGRERPDIAAAMQGASLINLERQGGAWVVTSGGFQSRRLNGTSFCRATGPGAERLGGAVAGIFGVGAGCATPAGRLLLLESEASDWATRLPGRVGAAHGWVVEVNPLDPQDIPAKRTALGRGAQSIAAAARADGRVVVFLALPGGLARFVAAAADTLDEGRLSAARIEGAALSWQALPEGAAADLPAALAAAGATRLPAGVSLANAPGGLLLTGAQGTSAIRHAGDDPGAETARLVPLLGAPGQTGAGLDGRGQLWATTEAAGERAAALLDARGSVVAGAPRGGSFAGIGATPDGAALLTCVRRPGAGSGRSFARPATRWPDFTPGVPPRSALVMVAR